MCLPPSQQGQGSGGGDIGPGVLTEALGDLESARDEVVNAVHQAPARRVDNTVSPATFLRTLYSVPLAKLTQKIFLFFSFCKSRSQDCMTRRASFSCMRALQRLYGQCTLPKNGIGI